MLVIAELLGVPARARARPAALVAGDRADVRAVTVRRGRRRGRRRGDRLRRAGARDRRRPPARAPRRPDQRPGRPPSCRRTRWWPSAVLLLNAGHEASVNVFGNGLVAMLRARAPARRRRPATVEEMLRFDSALQLFERTATAPSRSAASWSSRARRSRRSSAPPTATRRCSPRPTTFRRRARPQPPPRVRRRRALLPGCAAGADGAGRVAVRPVRGVPGPGAGRRAESRGHLRAARLPVGAGPRRRRSRA